MGDLTEGFEELALMRKKRHDMWKRNNTAIMDGQSDFAFKSVNNGETLLFRVEGKPCADFFPSTGRWINVETKKIYGGGAKAFLGWYTRSKLED